VDIEIDRAGKMQKNSTWNFALMLLILTIGLLLPQKVFAGTLAQDTIPTAAEVIEAVNALRIANGLLPLNPHPVLMQVAQWEANAIAAGAPGHTRPGGLTLGQWLISLGYPLAGDLSLDGYRSENWITIDTAQGAVDAWLGDGPHTNTMLSPDRSDIGAAVAVSDQVYIVLETALQTRSGQMQTDAYSILTAFPQGASSGSGSNLVPQYIIPVKRSTAHPGGDVIHKVQYGQSLWSIAIIYNTTIDQIRAWNMAADSNDLYVGQKLLVRPAGLVTITPALATEARAQETEAVMASTPVHDAEASITPSPPGSTPTVPDPAALRPTGLETGEGIQASGEDSQAAPGLLVPLLAGGSILIGCALLLMVGFNRKRV